MAFTLANLAELKNAGEYGLVVEALRSFPVLEALTAREISGKTYEAPVMTESTIGDFRAENTDRSSTDATFDLKTFTLKNFDASWDIDNQVARGVDNEKTQAILDACVQGSYYGAFKGISKYILDTVASATGFASLPDIAIANSRVTSAGTGSAGASGNVLLVDSRMIELLVGQDGSLFMADAPSKAYVGKIWKYVQQREGFVGVSSVNKEGVALIKNFTTSSTDVEAKILEGIYAYNGNYDMIVMPRAVAGLIQKERQAGFAGSGNLSLVDTIGGIKVVTDATMTLTHNAV